jgi:hypothetical protein
MGDTFLGELILLGLRLVCIENFNSATRKINYAMHVPEGRMLCMKTARLLLSVLIATVLWSGCVTGTTIQAAKEHVNYKPQKVEEGKITPLEVESIEKAKPGYYALVPFAVVADVALIPVYVLGTIAINLGILPVP